MAIRFINETGNPAYDAVAINLAASTERVEQRRYMKSISLTIGFCLALLACSQARSDQSSVLLELPSDLSKPVPGGILFVFCNLVDVAGRSPVPIDSYLNVDGRYDLEALSDSVRVEFIADYPDRAFIETSADRHDYKTTNFFLHGLDDHCTGVFSATTILIRSAKSVLEEPYTPMSLDGSGELRYSPSDTIDSEIWKHMFNKTDDYLISNAMVLNVTFRADVDTHDLNTDFMILDGEVIADRVITVD
jgi:hypothetical protein